MKEESYVLLHSNSSLKDTVTQKKCAHIVHPALRCVQGQKFIQRTLALQNNPPPLLRSYSAPSVSSSRPAYTQCENRCNVLGSLRMNSSSGGDTGSDTTHSQHGLSYQHTSQYHQGNSQHHHHQHHNDHVSGRPQLSRFTYPGFTTGGSTYNTYWTAQSGTDVTSVPEFRPSVHVPSLDLTAITLDDVDGEDSCKHKRVKSYKVSGEGDPALPNGCDKKLSMAEEKPGNRKQKASFVFPHEKSLADFDGVRKTPLHAVYEDPASTSPFSQRRRSFCAEEISPMEHSKLQQQQLHKQQLPAHKQLKQQDPSQLRTTSDTKDSQKVIHFSLANPKLGKYVLDEISPSSPTAQSLDTLTEPQRTRESMALKQDTNIDENETSPLANEGFGRRASDASHNVQEIIDVVVVDGHLNTSTEEREYRGKDNDTVVQDLQLEDVIPEPSKEKPKPRVTFSFENEIQSHRSIKRYTPVKMDVKPLQGVLKKRPEPTQVIDTNHKDRFEASKQTFFNDSNAAFRTSSSSRPEGPDQGGIRVKHLHTTNFDITREASKRGASVPSTMLKADKPPIPVSRRVALAAAENAALGINSNTNSSFSNGSTRQSSKNNNLLFTGGLTYICSNAHGRVAYFRPADVNSRTGEITTNCNNIKLKSRSTEDVNGSDCGERFLSGKPAYTNQGRSNRKTSNRATAISSPYTLRRSVSTDHAFVASGPGGAGASGSDIGGSKPAKPRVAFGSFIVPKETTPRMKKAQIKYQEVETGARPALGNGGTYIHSPTRRTSPYSAPTQILCDRSASAGGPSGFRRPYTAQITKNSRAQQTVGARPYSKESLGHQPLAQRHSAPSSFNSSKERVWKATAARQRISIDSSPSQGDKGSHDQLGRSKFSGDIVHNSSGSVGNSSGSGFLLPKKLNPHSAPESMHVPQGKQGVGGGVSHLSSEKLVSGGERLAVRTLSRPDLSALNMLANRDKGVSQTRFLATLSKAQHRE